MIKFFKYLPVLLLFLSCFACSLPPEKKYTLQEFKRSKGFAYYIIEDDPEGVLRVLNSRGDVVVKAEFFESPVYLQIFSTSEGILVRHYDRDEYDFDE